MTGYTENIQAQVLANYCFGVVCDVAETIYDGCNGNRGRMSSEQQQHFIGDWDLLLQRTFNINNPQKVIPHVVYWALAEGGIKPFIGYKYGENYKKPEGYKEPDLVLIAEEFNYDAARKMVDKHAGLLKARLEAGR